MWYDKQVADVQGMEGSIQTMNFDIVNITHVIDIMDMKIELEYLKILHMALNIRR